MAFIETSLLVESVKFIERLSKTEPLSNLISKQIVPEPGLSDTQLAEFVRNNAFSSWHPVGMYRWFYVLSKATMFQILRLIFGSTLQDQPPCFLEIKEVSSTLI